MGNVDRNHCCPDKFIGTFIDEFFRKLLSGTFDNRRRHPNLDFDFNMENPQNRHQRKGTFQSWENFGNDNSKWRFVDFLDYSMCAKSDIAKRKSNFWKLSVPTTRRNRMANLNSHGCPYLFTIQKNPFSPKGSANYV